MLNASTALKDQPGMPPQVPVCAQRPLPMLTPEPASAPNAPTISPSGMAGLALPAPREPTSTSTPRPAPSAPKVLITTPPKEPAPSHDSKNYMVTYLYLTEPYLNYSGMCL
jgi:hypothetical protein